MASISRIQNSLFSGTQETTLALANLNFDFSLIRVDAPPEYLGVGAALTTKRRGIAESGPIHVTARKLGSLFQSVLPPIPDLVRAYGKRASEISTLIASKPSKIKSYGAFQDYIGVDGTSIWAAATSSSSAIAVHLLACLLARAWSPSEAVSIWEELVAGRRAEVVKGEDTGFIDIRDANLSLLDISRKQLCEWDASARAWISAADCVDTVKKNQKQIMLVLDNINIPVNNRTQVYGSVIQTWKNALTTMDQIIKGTPYGIQDGAVLAALAAWHLYPDIVVLGKETVEIRQKDILVHQGGVLTIGLEVEPKADKKGLFWSLSLAHLRFYGYPILSERSIRSDAGRLSPVELILVALGCVMGSWGISLSDVDEAAMVVKLLKDCAQDLQSESPDVDSCGLGEGSWLDLMGRSAHNFLSSTKEEKRSYRRLVLLGLRKSSLLIPSHLQNMQIFDLSCNQILRCMKDTEGHIEILRKVATKLKLKPYEIIIRFRILSSNDNADQSSRPELPDWGYASALPFPSKPGSGPRFVRWLPSSHKPSECQTTLPTDEMRESYPDSNICVTDQKQSSFEWHSPPHLLSRRDPHVLMPEQPTSTVGEGTAAKRPAIIPAEDTTRIENIRYTPLVGDTTFAAIFRRADSTTVPMETNVHDPRYDLKDFRECLQRDLVGPALLRKHLSNLGQHESSRKSNQLSMVQSLKALSQLIQLYDQLAGATISSRLISSGRMLGGSKWARRAKEKEEGLQAPRSLDRPAAFACIAMCESGFLDLDPEQLDLVMALSSGDSLYVGTPLLQDPAIKTDRPEVRRVIGNIGRAGVALLIPPQDPKLPSPDPDAWNVINHDPFDGKVVDSFPGASLHLSFTGYELPLAVENHGERFTEAFFIEAAVSLYERGRWISDLNILSLFNSPNLLLLAQQSCCSARGDECLITPETFMTSIDEWEELLDRQSDHPAVVRAHENWQARLAAAAASTSLGNTTLVFEGEVCWKCGEQALRQLEIKEMGSRDKKVTRKIFVL